MFSVKRLQQGKKLIFISMFKNFMKLAIIQANQAKINGEVPVGAVIIDPKNNIIAKECNRTIELQDPTGHAEILSIREACLNLGSDKLINCSIYVTLEPCAMCAAAISQAGLSKLYFGLSDPKSGGVENGARIYQHQQTHHKPEVYSGFHEEEIATIMKGFFFNLRAGKKKLS